MTVREIMSPQVVSVKKDESVCRVAGIMKDNDIGSVPVICDGSVCGMITDRDIVIRCVANSKNPENCHVGDIMTDMSVCASADWSINEALEAMARQQVRRLPVTNDGKLIGMLSLGDIARQRVSPETAKSLSEISMP